MQSQILWNEPLGAGYYRLGLRCQGDLSSARPGQFIMLQVAEGKDPLLKRPFSIHRLSQSYRPAEMEILYKTVGRGTHLMRRLAPGMGTEILAPLGRGFKVPLGLKRIYIAAGGIGVAPMGFLVDSLISRGYSPRQLHIFLGARSREDLIGAEDFRRQGLRVHLTTDDGSAGDQCLITDPLAGAVRSERPDLLLACGPNPMLACILGIAETHQLSCQVSVEAHMACGVGACLGCAIPSRGLDRAYLHVCLNGPVFPAEQIKIP
ncbi:MAG: dihydroorotate dehydrogenase electron transfer subunit [Desulfobacterales bacterium]